MQHTRQYSRVLVALLALTSPLATLLTAQSTSRQLVLLDRAPSRVIPETTASISLSVTNVPVESALRAIAAQAGLQLLLNRGVTTGRTTVQLQHVSVQAALDAVMHGTGAIARVTPDGRTIIVAPRPADAQATGTISGIVVDATTKRPIHGARVSISGTSLVATSDENGRYTLRNVPASSYALSVKALGYTSTSQRVAVTEGESVTVNLSLDVSVNALDRIVVTGTVVETEQKAVPNAMTVITAKEIQQRGITHIDQLFRGDVPGLFVQNRGSAALLGEVNMFSRGASNFDGSNRPASNAIKTYVDGVEIANPTYLSQIDPASIERVEIITGPQASTIYGSNAINGVMQIFTKRGTTARPQVTATLLSGLIQNNWTTNLTPQHDYAAQLNGTEARWSYNVGGSWNYIGPWTPSTKNSRTSGYGGARLQAGPLTGDASIRLASTQSWTNGSGAQLNAVYSATGLWTPSGSVGNIGYEAPTTSTLGGQTLGMTVSYTPTTWWSHEAVIGTDVSDIQTLQTAPQYGYGGDSLLSINQSHNSRTSLRYTTTAKVALTSLAQATLTLGADQWKSLTTSLGATSPTLNGTLSTPSSLTRQADHNTGAFFQGQLGVADALFLTYGLRAEWNPNYGSDATPNVVPRYGIAYTHDVGPITAKLRASYGHSTRPPTSTQKLGQVTTSTTYGRYVYLLPSPELGPEFQQGGEGGLEFYLGNRASLIVTRYNQTVDGLVAAPKVDSVISLVPSTTTGLYTYASVTQNLNVGTIRNQGWELQGSLNTGPLTTKGTYSWTKSRFLGITPKYRTFLNSTVYQVGRSFTFLPEHTWALTTTYAHTANTFEVNVNGTGFLFNQYDPLATVASTIVRLQSDRPRNSLPSGYRNMGPGYVMADLNASHRFSTKVEGVFQVQNLTNFYQTDFDASFAAIGRQTKAGLRIRL